MRTRTQVELRDVELSAVNGGEPTSDGAVPYRSTWDGSGGAAENLDAGELAEDKRKTSFIVEKLKAGVGEGAAAEIVAGVNQDIADKHQRVTALITKAKNMGVRSALPKTSTVLLT